MGVKKMTIKLFSVAKKTFADKTTGKVDEYYVCYAADDKGVIGQLYSKVERKAGDEVKIRLYVNKQASLPSPYQTSK